MGANPDLVLHGGGNTSVKLNQQNFFGDSEELLLVKGSGWDLATIEPPGFAPVRLETLKRLAELETLSDTEMVRQQRAAMTDPGAPNPSVEAILHALIPFRYVDHTHADAVLGVTNHPNGEKSVQEIYGNRVIVIPYVMPGFVLAKKVRELTQGKNWEDYEGMILMNHGIFTFDDDARESYEKMIRLVTEAEDYVRPEISDDGGIDIRDGRHPVVERQLRDGRFVPNDMQLDSAGAQVMLITGPNMAGKSTYLRQVALICLMAQIGSFVPAQEMTFSLVDRIFTRVGASDNISMGESTFMVEMNETASILNNLTGNSLILLDEIGRGTSTYDGISIAWAIAEFLHENKLKPHVLFATHYHDLNEMESIFKGIRNFNVSVKQTKDDVIFLRKLVKGGSNHSFGIHVAKMAGMPRLVLSSAENKLKLMETSRPKNLKEDKTDDNLQLSFFDIEDPKMQEIRKIIEDLDIDNLSPVEALLKLNQIKKEIKDGD